MSYAGTQDHLLYNITDKPEIWRTVMSSYSEVLSLKASKLKPEKQKDLKELDQWYQTELPEKITARKEKFINKEELCRLMKWKLTRGKFRPRLTEMVATNSEELVKDSSTKAFKKLPNLSEAISCLTVLKAVGPATASAVLAAGSPQSAPFMADESMLAIPGLEPLNYTLNFYKSYAAEVAKMTKALNKSDSVKDWTAHSVELTLWTHHVGKSLNPAMFNDMDARSAKRENDKDENPGSKKKRKT